MLSSECAAHFLERDQLLHIDMLECIRRGNATCLYVGERGVLLRDEPSSHAGRGTVGLSPRVL